MCEARGLASSDKIWCRGWPAEVGLPTWRRRGRLPAEATGLLYEDSVKRKWFTRTNAAVQLPFWW